MSYSIEHPEHEVWWITYKDEAQQNVEAYGSTTPAEVTSSKYPFVKYENEQAWLTELAKHGITPDKK